MATKVSYSGQTRKRSRHGDILMRGAWPAGTEFLESDGLEIQWDWAKDKDSYIEQFRYNHSPSAGYESYLSHSDLALFMVSIPLPNLSAVPIRSRLHRYPRNDPRWIAAPDCLEQLPSSYPTGPYPRCRCRPP